LAISSGFDFSKAIGIPTILYAHRVVDCFLDFQTSAEDPDVVDDFAAQISPVPAAPPLPHTPPPLSSSAAASVTASDEVAAAIIPEDVLDISSDVDGVYSVPLDAVKVISKSISQLEDEDRRTTKNKSVKLSRRRELKQQQQPVKQIAAAAVPRKAVAKISVKTDRVRNVTQVSILPSEGQRGQSHSFQINTANLARVGKLLKPLQLEKLSVFNEGVPPPPPSPPQKKKAVAAAAASNNNAAKESNVGSSLHQVVAAAAAASSKPEQRAKKEPVFTADLPVRHVRLDKDQGRRRSRQI
jgi:hypothetical protein